MELYNPRTGKVEYFVEIGDSGGNSNSNIKTFTELGVTKNTSSYTFKELADEIQSLGLPTATIIYGEVQNTPMPSGVTNAEVKIEILDTKTGGQIDGKQVMLFTLYSSDVDPYVWTFVYYQPNYEQNQQTWDWQSSIAPLQCTISIFTGNTGNILDTQLALGNFVRIERNGQAIYQGLDKDYTISGSVITFIVPLVATDRIAVINGNLTALDLTSYRQVPETITISDATYSLDIAPNKDYQFTNADLGQLTFNSCANSNLETTITFDATASTSLVDNSGITWVAGSIPTLTAGKTYLIVIYNKLGFVKEY